MEERKGKIWTRSVAAAVFMLSLLTYFFTVEPTASYWDCPEYVAVGSLLEIGHPPGNPTWMLVARMASMLSPSPQYTALAVNLTSGLFTALAALLLFYIILDFTGIASRPKLAPRLVGSAAGALIFAWCDSVWFSATEAEVYAFSIFCTALCFRLMQIWAREWPAPSASRWIVLTAYITGLSIGVHQLNLLVIPALCLIWLFRARPERCGWRAWAALFAGFVIVALLLFGMMNGTVETACLAELLCVNTLGLPYHSGIIVCAALLLISLIATLAAIWHGRRTAAALCMAPALWLSGIFIFGDHLLAGAVISAIAAAVAWLLFRRFRHALYIGMWCLTMLLTGFSTYNIILLRGAANPPLNEGAPSDIFAFRSYLQREQYGSHPLFHGPTPYSRLMRREKLSGDSLHPSATYQSYYFTFGRPQYRQYVKGLTRATGNTGVEKADSAANARAARRGELGKDAYIMTGRSKEFYRTPELDIWFPRIYSADPADLEAYEGWSGMTPATMDSVEISEAYDADGSPVGKIDPLTGERRKDKALRPTYLQNFIYMCSYQMGYMYFRYLFWNFSGRQNGFYATGEADNGNFITGVQPLDDAMLGPQHALPAETGRDNPGRHLYYGIPLLLGIAGIVWQLTRGRRGKRQAAVTLTFFLMTGVAIAFYLNQSPGEPRERDYSFVGSFMAWAVWCGLGGFWAVDAASRLLPRRKAATTAASLLLLAIPAWMFGSNLADHDRSHRTITSDFAANMLESLEPGAIIFVNGDNYTFPVWYVREVERVRPDVRVINVAYLGTPWYVLQMMVPDRESAPVPLTAPASAIRSGALASTYFGAATADTLDAVEALRGLYAQSDSDLPRWPAKSIRFADGTVIDLAAAAKTGRTSLGLSQLMMLDIAATNAASPRPRPIYWMSRMPGSHFAGLRPFTRDEGLATRYIGLRDTTGLLDADRFLLTLRRMRWGGAERGDVWFDCTSGDQITDLRMRLVRLSRQLLDAGRTAEAVEVLQRMERGLRAESWGYRVNTDRYVTYSEPTEMALIYAEAARRLGRPDLKRHAFALLRAEIKRLGQWRAFRRSVPAARLGYMSPRVLAESTELIAPAEAWLAIGGKKEQLLAMPELRRLNFEQEIRSHSRNHTLRLMLRAARFPATPGTLDSLHDLYISLGGTDDALTPYVELSGRFTSADN